MQTFLLQHKSNIQETEIKGGEGSEHNALASPLFGGYSISMSRQIDHELPLLSLLNQFTTVNNFISYWVLRCCCNLWIVSKQSHHVELNSSTCCGALGSLETNNPTISTIFSVTYNSKRDSLVLELKHKLYSHHRPKTAGTSHRTQTRKNSIEHKLMSHINFFNKLSLYYQLHINFLLFFHSCPPKILLEGKQTHIQE